MSALAGSAPSNATFRNRPDEAVASRGAWKGTTSLDSSGSPRAMALGIHFFCLLSLSVCPDGLPCGSDAVPAARGVVAGYGVKGG